MSDKNKGFDGGVLDEAPNCWCTMPSVMRVSHSEKNPDRVFYACSKEKDDPSKCGMFVWQDAMPPMCCGTFARTCKVKKEGPNKGKTFYTCPKDRDDETNCKFFEWQDKDGGKGQNKRARDFQTAGEYMKQLEAKVRKLEQELSAERARLAVH